MYNIPLRVKNLMNKHGSCDIYRILDDLKIAIICTKVPHRAHGFWRRILRRKIIFIDEELTEEWQIRAVLCHELGHILLHPGYKSFCLAGRTFFANSKKENEADEFAAELLIHTVDKSYVLDFLKNGWKI